MDDSNDTIVNVSSESSGILDSAIPYSAHHTPRFSSHAAQSDFGSSPNVESIEFDITDNISTLTQNLLTQLLNQMDEIEQSEVSPQTHQSTLAIRYEITNNDSTPDISFNPFLPTG